MRVYHLQWALIKSYTYIAILINEHMENYTYIWFNDTF